jgi:CIC family chloride channel protein
MLGGAVGSMAHAALPHHVAFAGAYALVGMGTAFAGIVRVPMTSVIMIFEVTRDYSIIVPLMISNLISFFISRQLQPEPIYEALSRQDGIHLPGGAARAHRSSMRVSQAMRTDVPPIEREATIAETLARIHSLGIDAWPVAEGRRLLGMITASQLESAADDGARFRTVSEIMTPPPEGHLDAESFPHIHPDHSLDVALERMGAAHVNALPVVGRANVREILGVITLPDILRAYGINHPR